MQYETFEWEGLKIEKDSRISRTMYRKRFIFMKSVMITFLMIVAAFQSMGYLKLIERNSHDTTLGPITFEKADKEVDTSVGETVQYN
ncbi:MAG: hypothetical protein RR533_08145 [Carnobacterium sp.]